MTSYTNLQASTLNLLSSCLALGINDLCRSREVTVWSHGPSLLGLLPVCQSASTIQLLGTKTDAYLGYYRSKLGGVYCIWHVWVPVVPVVPAPFVYWERLIGCRPCVHQCQGGVRSLTQPAYMRICPPPTPPCSSTSPLTNRSFSSPAQKEGLSALPDNATTRRI